jgi:hypothetical protein
MRINFSQVLVLSLLFYFCFFDFFLLKKALHKSKTALTNLATLMVTKYKTQSKQKRT